MTRKSWQRAVLGDARELGIAAPHIVQQGRHPKLIGFYAGCQIIYVIAGSPSDGRRARKNVKAGLKRRVREIAQFTQALPLAA